MHAGHSTLIRQRRGNLFITQVVLQGRKVASRGIDLEATDTDNSIPLMYVQGAVISRMHAHA
jgi:hypothetical protein